MTRQTVGWFLVALQFALLIGLVLLPRRDPSLLSLAVGVPLIAAGAVLGFAAFRHLGEALTPTPVPIAGAGLRTGGLYRWVRHPIYSAILLMALGYVILMGTWWSALGLVVLLLFFWGKSRWEDRLLHDQYGEEWATWASRTGALIPRRP
jgi:protein-S-isoprenylcysteine O-methyltransferase Ste14